jgi:hypothetical protein
MTFRNPTRGRRAAKEHVAVGWHAFELMACLIKSSRGNSACNFETRALPAAPGRLHGLQERIHEPAF